VLPAVEFTKEKIIDIDGNSTRTTTGTSNIEFY
jgi:hypothetical protein